MNNGRGGGDNDVVKDLEAMGAPAEVIQKFQREQIKEGNFEVFPENWEALFIFLKMSTQWRSNLISTGKGFISCRTGLDYTALESLMRMQGVENQADAFDRIRILETRVLEEMNKQ